MQKSLPSIAAGGVLTVLLLALAALMNQPRAGSAHSAPDTVTWGPDIRISSVSTDTLRAQRDPALAVNPANPNVAAAAYEVLDTRPGNTGFAWSTDAGQSWRDSRPNGPWISGTMATGKPDLGFDGNGVLYLATAVQSNVTNGYLVLTTTNGSTWSDGLPVALDNGAVVREQDRLAVDEHTSGPYAGSLYMAWHVAGTESHGVWLRYSRDGGRTWSADIVVSNPGHEEAERPALAVAPDGSLYAAFMIGDEEFYINHSTDGGVTWGTDTLITGVPVTPIGALDDKNRELQLVGGPSDTGFAINNSPFIAVAPDDPRTVYAVWNDGRWDTGFIHVQHPGVHGDIAFSRSLNGGASWSEPIRLNDDAVANGVDQFSPAIDVHSSGLVGITWYDRRNDPDAYLYDRYYSESADGGQTWGGNIRVSDQSSDPLVIYNGKGQGELGEYNAMAYGPDYVLAAWVDSRSGVGQDIYGDRGLLTNLPPPCAMQFSDVHPADYFYTPVQFLTCHGIVSGYNDGTYRPYNNTTRGQLTKMVVNGMGWIYVTPPTPTFVDVPANDPFYTYIETAVAHNVISGYTCGGPGEPCPGRYFRPAANVTRGQLSKMIASAKGWVPLTPAVPTFVDVPATNAFYGYVEAAVAHGVISGYTCGGSGEPCPGRYFRPAADATRGQLSKILYNALQQP
ncbi:MAG TPA: S-layer homology domain-containing protein [Chloroflexia bacterium]|nr:S-layer homology domain-containing protein [Chloroflexia bacterium]